MDTSTTRAPFQPSALPEPVKHTSSPTHSDHHTPLFTVLSSDPKPSALHNPEKEVYFPPPQSSTAWGRSQSRWRTWPFLLVFGIVIAIVAGLVGGFIGRAIEHRRQNDGKSGGGSTNHDSASPQASVCPSPTPGNSTSSTNSNNNALQIPSTGCPDTSGRTFQSTYTSVTYKLYCNVDWIGSDIASVYAPAVSDCIEACNTVNQYNLIGKSCIGATFVPAWVNRTKAIENVNRPSNCFLKYNATGYPVNRRLDNVTVVCLEGKCPQG